MKTDERHFSVSADTIWFDGNVGEQWLVIDLRSGDEFRRGHIPGALHIPEAELAAHDVRIKLAAGGRPIACVCSPGQDFEGRGGQMAYLGAGVVRRLEGGVAAWFDLGFPLVPTPFASAPSWLRGSWGHLGKLLMLGGALMGALVWPGFLLMSGVGWALHTGRSVAVGSPLRATTARS
ncbi:MAG: rhodanese-related sulfurtransferase [Chlamydiales bacterium]|jgi:rhodanese-related sulfurtransferase